MILTMTAPEFRALAVAIYGKNNPWRLPLAARLGVSPRTIRRWASGKSRIPVRIVQALRAITPTPDWPRDEWICGEGLPVTANHRREYVVHTAPPRFIARAVALENDDNPTNDEEPADNLSGIVYSASPDTDLCEIVWLDPPPPTTDEITAPLRAAAKALLT